MTIINLNDVKNAIEKAPEQLILSFAEKTVLHHVQKTKRDKDDYLYYREGSSRCSDPAKKVGVFYCGYSEALVIAESFQQQDGQVVTLASLDERSIHRVETTRELKLVDLGALAPRLGFKTRHVVQARGKEGEGYALPQALSKACMDLGYDGVVYNSAVYCPAGSLDGANVVLFEGRGTQVKRISLKPVNTLLLWDRETVAEFLESLDAM